jgi:ABC-type protease/lipase transport system fused ATPase/permease subunit
VLAAVNYLLVMDQGRAQAFGPKDQVTATMMRREAGPPRPLKVVPDAGGATS